MKFLIITKKHLIMAGCVLIAAVIGTVISINAFAKQEKLLPIYCVETEEKKISVAAVRNAVFVIIYAVAYCVSLLPFEFTKYLSLPLILVRFVWIIFNLVLIFSCYARICDESDVNMEQKPSRFAFINEMRAQNEARQKEKEEKWAERANQRKKRK